MNLISDLYGAAPRSLLLRASGAAALALAASVSNAEPLNPLDFTSVGNKSFVAGTHTILTDTATLSGPSGSMTGTVGTPKTLVMVIGCTGAADTAVNGRLPVATAPFARAGNGILSNLTQRGKTTNKYTFTPTHAGPYQQTLTFLSDGGKTSVLIKCYGECRSDLKQDLIVDDADFAIFAGDDDSLNCP